jgi:hypothetical protein
VLGPRPVVVLADTGAGANFLSQGYAERHGLSIDSTGTSWTTTANGRKIRTLGCTTLPFNFQGSHQEHKLEFHVLPHCVSDVVLGNPFLKLTNAFSRFAHCIRKKLRMVPFHRVRYQGLGLSENRMGGLLNGHFVAALPDTGSDVMLMRRSYAVVRGFHINNDPDYQIELEFGDQSRAWTTGFVDNVEWELSDVDLNPISNAVDCSFFIVEDLACDVILSDEFLERTNAFNEFADCEFESSILDMAFNAIKAVEIHTKDGAGENDGLLSMIVSNICPDPEKGPLEQWEDQMDAEVHYQNEAHAETNLLPEDERAPRLQALRDRYQAAVGKKAGGHRTFDTEAHYGWHRRGPFLAEKDTQLAQNTSLQTQTRQEVRPWVLCCGKVRLALAPGSFT